MDILPNKRLVQELDALLPDLKRWHSLVNGSEPASDDFAGGLERVPAVMARLTPVFAELAHRGFTLPTCPPLWEDQRGWVNIVVPYLTVHRDVVAGREKPSRLQRLSRWAAGWVNRRSVKNAPAPGADPLGLRASPKPAEPARVYRSGMTEAELVYWCGPPDMFQECVAKVALWFDVLIEQVVHDGPYLVDVNKETPIIRDVLDVVIVPRLTSHGFVAPAVPEWEEDPLAWYEGWKGYFGKVLPYVQADAAAGMVA